MITKYLPKKIVQSIFLLNDCSKKDRIFYFLNIFLLFVIFIGNSAKAQVANYTFSESSGTYAPLTAPTTAIPANWNDIVTANTIPIGFSFGFNGTNYSTCSINSNGFITFGSTLSVANNYTPISTNTAYSGAIAALGVNMWDLLPNPITYITTGSSPNRVFTVQWKDADRFDRGDEFNFQIQLNETTNVIKIVYGLCFPIGSNGQNINVQVGLRGASNTDYNNRNLTTNSVVWDNNTTAGTSNAAACRTRGTNYPNSGRTFIWSPVLPPTITSLATSSGCVGDVITINGTNLIGITAANVKLGGTAVTTILTNTGTQITAIIGAGTTGLVTIQNAAGTGTSLTTYTLNPAPTITSQPVAPTASCVGGATKTISVTATGATSYQWRLNGVALTNIAPFSNVTTSTITITALTLLSAGTYDVVVGNAGSCTKTSNGVVFIVNDVPTIANTPSPANEATGICYSGAGAITNVSWTAVVGAVNYDVYFGAGSLPKAVTVANLTVTNYTPATLVASTTYYWKVIAKNACGSAIGSSTWTFTTLVTACACVPIYSSGAISGVYISNVKLGVLSNNTGASLTPFYTNYNTLPIPVIQRSTTQPVSITMGYQPNQYAAVWIDFNNNGVFETTEGFVSGIAVSNTPIFINVVVPVGAVLGNVKMRIRNNYNIALTTSQACGATSSTYGETEDYIVNIVNTIACAAASPPTALSLSPNNTSISGSFTLPSPLGDGYLVVRSTSATPPTPANGTSYSINSTTLGAGTLVIDNDNNNIFSTTGLTASVTYYFYVFSIKLICSGGLVYSTVLSGNTKTTALTVGCITATSTDKTFFINSFKTVGNLTNVDNSNTGYTHSGYTDYTSLPTTTQIVGGGINVKYALNLSTSFKAWVDWNSDGVFTEPGERVYDSGNFVSASTTFGFVVPIATITGNYRLRIRAYSVDSGAPANETLATIIPCTNLSNGETEDYKLTVVADCASKITNVVDGKRCDNGVVVLSATATAATTEFRWYNAEVGGTLIGISYKIGATLDTHWATPTLSTTEIYWVEAWSATCASFYREKVIATVNATSIITFNPTNPIICGENTIIAVSATGDFEVVDLVNEDFEGTAQLNTASTTVTGSEWTTKTSTLVPTGTALWRPAINSRNAGNKFGYTTSNQLSLTLVDTSLISNTLNSTGFLDLNLSFRHYFSYYPVPGDHGYVQISTNGGTSWTDIFHYQSDKGEAGSFETVTIALSATYLNQSNLKIRYYYSSQGGNGWAIDDIRLYGTKPINTTFSWGGGADAYADALATIPYNSVTMSLATVYIKPTPAQLASSSWTFTANATIANGCVVSKPITLTNNTRKWLGTTTDWNLASNWLQGSIPSINSCVIIPNNSAISGTNYNAFAKNVLINSTGNLLVQPTNNITIADDLKIDSGGTFELKNSASLVQVNAVANTVNGTFKMERITQPMYRYDYTYWGSPLKSGSFTLGNLSPLSTQSYSWTPSIAGNFGNWAPTSTATVMDPTKGYAVLAPNNWTLDAANKVAFSTNFIGNPNNGIVTSPITFGTLGNISDNKWNLIANPYPCAINADLFLGNALNTPLIDGTIYFWTHNTQPSTLAAQPFYGTYSQNYTVDDYALWNRLGGVGTQATPAITAPNIPNSISGGQAPNGFIAAGTGFFVKSLGVAGSVTFNNSMRVTSNNAQFFRNATSILDTNIDNNNNTAVFEKHRIWLNLSNNSNAFSQTLLGYAEGATNDIDRAFDGERIGGNGIGFYSLSNEIQLGIQARALPFDENQDVPIGMTLLENGNYNIGIEHLDGLFENQNVYLEDKLLNIIHDLKSSQYNFSSDLGIINNRFVLKYKNPFLANNDFEILNDFRIATAQKLTLHSTNQNIKKVEVFDLLDRRILELKNLNTKSQTLDNLLKSDKIYIIKTTFENDVVASKKVIF